MGLFTRRIQLILMWMTVAAACYLAYGFGRLWAEWRQAAQLQTGPAPLSDQVNIAALLPLAGQWSFADLDWDLVSREVAAEKVDPLLAALEDQSPSNDCQHLPDVDEIVLQLAKSLNIEPVDRGDSQIYRLDSGGVKAVMVVRIVDGTSKAAALAAAFPLSGDRWRFIEFTPGRSSSPTANVKHLLPLPPNANRSGGRFAADGRLLLELIALESHAEELVAAWQKSGWEVRPSGMGGPDDFSYLCARGDDVIYAWSADRCDALRNLMLVRAPAGSDTGP